MADYTEIFILVIAILVIIVLVMRAYRSKKAKPLPSKKPFFAPFPKYVVDTVVKDASNDEATNIELIQDKLSDLGFRRAKGKIIRFHRGRKFGDFSTKLARINIDFVDPVAAESRFEIYYGWFALFDTGDLWKLASEVKARLEQ